MRRVVVPAIVIVLAAGAFILGDGGTQPVSAAELETFPDCSALHSRLVSSALDHVGPHGLDGAPMPMPFAVPADGAATDTVGSGEAQAAGAEVGTYTSETGTNVQVGGVDEPDHVKLSDDLLAVIEGQRVLLLDVSDPVPAVLGTVQLPTDVSPSVMLSTGDRLVVFGHLALPPVPSEGRPASDVPGDVAGDAVAPGEPWGWVPPATAVVVLDVSEPASPQLLHRMDVAATFVSARLVAGRVLLVTAAGPTIPFVFPSDGPGAEEAAEGANREAVRRSDIEQWLPTVTFDDGRSRTLADCDQVGVPDEVVSWQSVNMASFDPAGDLRDVAAAATFGAGDTVYATADRVYVAGTWWGRDTDREKTAIHAFATDTPPAHVASGELEGRLLNQFAMDRFEDHLRVATTVSEQDRGGTDSRVVVFAERSGELVEVGRVTGLGRPGETIRGIRYVGPVGYVVTFEQTDPLYTVSLDDPRRPRVLGELKIPGYSAYLHPIADGRLLGVGSAAEDDGRVTGLQISLFDVSDLVSPIRRAVLELPGGSTPIEWDHHAFTWLADAGIAAMPFESWSGVGGFTGPEANSNAGLLLVRADDDGLSTVAMVGAPKGGDGWSSGFSRALAHEGSLLAVGPGAVWRIALDGEVLAETALP